MREALEKALIHRKPLVFMADEAQHFGKTTSGRKLQDQFDIIKTLAETTGVLHVLIGTYELLPFRNLNGQLSRRKMEIHFRRYHIDNDKEIRAFRKVINTFQHHMPLAEMPNLIEIWDFLYERSIGCIGVLKDWLVRALDRALEEGGKLTIEHIQKTVLSISACAKMAEEALYGELELEEESKRQRLRYLLGLDLAEQNVQKNTKKGNEEPGKRRPKRDKVGQRVVNV